MPKKRINETHIIIDWNTLTDEERKTSSSEYWYKDDDQ